MNQYVTLVDNLITLPTAIKSDALNAINVPTTIASFLDKQSQLLDPGDSLELCKDTYTDSFIFFCHHQPFNTLFR